MQATLPRVLIFPTLRRASRSSPTIILSKVNNEIRALQSQMNPVEPSCIYTAARLLLKEVHDKEYQDAVTMNTELNLWFDDHFKYWLRKFVDADFYETEKNYSFIVPVDGDVDEISSDKVIEATEDEFKGYSPDDYNIYIKAKTYYEDAEKQGLIKYYGALNCDISRHWNDHYEALYSGIFRQNGERWLRYSASGLNFPSDDELSKLKGLVISGADHAAYDETVPFHDELYKFLQKANANYPHLKLLGVCFGCQVLAHCLGGKTSKMEGLGRPWIAGLEAVQANAELKNKEYYKKTKSDLNLQSDEFVAVEAHGDNVEKLPEKAVLLGSSKTTPVEMWGIGDRVLSVQFHPEFNSAAMKYKVIEGNDIPEEKRKSLLRDYEESEKGLTLDRSIPITICKNFLKCE